jgi:hypothetical protein
MSISKVSALVLTAFLTTLGFHQIAQARDLRIVQQLKKSLPHLAKKNLVKKISPVCANFTGNWTGICIDSHGDQEPWEAVIDQEKCEYISMDGTSFNINGLNTIANSPGPNSEWPLNVGGSVSTTWNDAQTRLYKSVGFSIAGWFSGVSTQEIWLEGDTLRTKDTASYTLDPTGVPSPMQMIMQDCTFSRR